MAFNTLMTIAAAGFIGASALGSTPATQPVETNLSSAEISAYLAGNQQLPPNCSQVGDPCIYIICGAPTQPGDWPRGLYACEPD